MSYLLLLFITICAAHRKREQVWNTARTIVGKNPAVYRTSEDNKPIYYHSYGQPSAMGWDVDHIRPKSKGGSDDIGNLQTLTSHLNRGIGNSPNKPNRHHRKK